MNRMVLGALAALVLVGIGLFWLQGRAQVEKGAPPPVVPTATPTGLPSGDLAGINGPGLPKASELTREQQRFFRYDRNRDLKITRNEMLSTRVDDFRKLDLLTILSSAIPWEKQQLLEKFAPEKIHVPSGSYIRITYADDGSPPVLAVRLQEIFGMLETPSVNEGRTKLMVHLLSPAYRPVQVTQDLHSFWKNTYAEVRKELRMRYPKHSWPEDPYTAVAIRGAKKRQ